jgi:CMP-N-acetylneuraminic acid synthetase
MAIIAVIPARGGSKRIKRKNLKLLNGAPLLYWTVISALSCSELFDRIYVSSEDAEILEAAKSFGVSTIERPAELATDEAKTVDVVKHALEMHEKTCGRTPDYIMTLQPTSPLRTKEDIKLVLEIAYRREADSFVSVCRSHYHPVFIKKIDSNGFLLPACEPEPKEGIRRQDVPYQAWVRDGSIYLTALRTLRSGSLFGDRIFPVEFPSERSIDIDDEIDFRYAEFLMSRYTS